MEKHPNKYYLTQEQLKFFDDNGYLVIKGLIDMDTIANVSKRFYDVCNNADPQKLIRIVRDVSLIKEKQNVEDHVNKINFLNFDPVFSQYHEHPRLLHVIQQLIGENLSMLNSMVINKPPGSKWHPPHQDAFYVPMRPIEKILTAWTAVDPVFETNGSLFVVPGSHKENIIHPEVNVPDLTNIMYFMIPDVDAVAPYNKRVTVAPMEPGDTVFFHPLLVHGSWPNTSNMFRKAITSLYVSQESYYIDVKGTPLEAFEKSLNEVIKGMYGPDVGEITFKDFIELRIKHLGRSKSNL